MVVTSCTCFLIGTYARFRTTVLGNVSDRKPFYNNHSTEFSINNKGVQVCLVIPDYTINEINSNSTLSIKPYRKKIILIQTIKLKI